MSQNHRSSGDFRTRIPTHSLVFDTDYETLEISRGDDFDVETEAEPYVSYELIWAHAIPVNDAGASGSFTALEKDFFAEGDLLADEAERAHDELEARRRRRRRVA